MRTPVDGLLVDPGRPVPIAPTFEGSAIIHRDCAHVGAVHRVRGDVATDAGEQGMRWNGDATLRAEDGCRVGDDGDAVGRSENGACRYNHGTAALQRRITEGQR